MGGVGVWSGPIFSMRTRERARSHLALRVQGYSRLRARGNKNDPAY
jgi:hypothetical protein